MKKIIISLAAIAVFTMVSCKKEQPTGTGMGGNDIITAFTESKDTKTSLSGNDSEGYDVLWSKGDKIKIGDNIFTLIDGEGTTKGTFRGTLPKDGTYTAYYPETIKNGWPEDFMYSGNSISGSPMSSEVTVSDGKIDEPISFQNWGGILRLTLKGTATIREIQAWGEGHRYLKCGGGVELDITDGKVFYIPMPATTYTALSLHFYTIEGRDIIRQLKNGKELIIDRSGITDLSLSGIDSTVPQGILPGGFSVAEGGQVHFSKGNLRYTVDSGKWSFFDRQYDCGPSDYPEGHDKEISLFTWGYDSTKSIVPDGKNGDNVSISSGDLEKIQDWGAQIGSMGTWRTLTSAEWGYLFKTRADAGKKYGLATVCGIHGLIILPDTFNDPLKNQGGEAFKPKAAHWTDNIYTGGGDWESMEYEGAVFLPAAGLRDGNEIWDIGGYYWSSSVYPDNINNAGLIYFSDNVYFNEDNKGRQFGCSVRPVTGVYTVTFDLNGKPGTTPASIENLLYGSTVTKPASPSITGYVFAGWFKDPECTEQWNFNTELVTANITLYAGWADLISSRFTVNGSGKQVHFSRGNLWADSANTLHFENDQWYFNNSYSSDHISHFTWAESVSGAVGASGSGDHLFCDESHKVSVNGSIPVYYALSKDEWKYLFKMDTSDENARRMEHCNFTHSCNIDYCGKRGLVIYPDDYNGDKLDPDIEYTIETFPQDCVFLPGAGWRDGTTIYQVGYWNGFYWSSSADVQNRPYNVEFLTDKVCISEPGNKNSAFSIRLVADAI